MKINPFLVCIIVLSARNYAGAIETAPQFDGLTTPPPSMPPQRGAANLEKLVESVALYPDPLIAVLLPAAAYPVEVVQAARFVADTNNLATLDNQLWDENVKAVARFPSVIQKMSDELGWTVELGQAFVEQPLEVMDVIQSLRSKAQSAGTLQTTPQQVVIVTNAVVERTYETQIVYVTNTVVQIVPASPQLIYVPVYSPAIVYYPPPTYVYNPMAPVIVFGAGIAVGAIIANNHCNWYYGGVYRGPSGVVVWGGGYGRYPYYPPPPRYRPPPYYPPPGYRPPPPGYRPPGYPPRDSLPPGRSTPYASQQWQPDQNRLRQSGTSGSAAASIATMEARGWGSASSPNSTPPGLSTRPAVSTGSTGSRPNPAPVGTRPSTGAIGSRPNNASNPAANQQPTRLPASVGITDRGTGVSRPASSGSTRQITGTAPSGSAFGDLSSGAGARDSSNRGAVSRGTNSGSTHGRSTSRR
ncbi:MAG TPA: DUF3300 domain-containing protein [Verrucomicrobiae bacterium]|nr:DUF3300 domain-containing protein [Verrucomicrobiae bacterium]